MARDSGFFKQEISVNKIINEYDIDGINDNKINLLLSESGPRQFIYEPYTQFKEHPRNDLYQHVTEHGFRSIKNQGPWQTDTDSINIFVFGGSTTFGYGVADYQSIPSFLQEHLRNELKNVNVYNFGRGYYYSTQERILYEKLLSNGHLPDIAIFIDGLNEFFNYQDFPAMTETIKTYMNQRDFYYGHSINFLRNILGKLPIMRAYKYLTKNQDSVENIETFVNVKASKVLNTYLNNKKMIEAISKAYGVQPFFVWQPVPFYNSIDNSTFFDDSKNNWFSYGQTGYNLMNVKRLNAELGKQFFWLADFKVSDRGKLYIDRVHYSPNFASELSQMISNFISPKLNQVTD